MNFHPTLESRMPIGSFGTPKTFRVPQNTTCYVRLNMNFQCLKIILWQPKFYWKISIGALVITLVGYLFITNKQSKQSRMSAIISDYNK